MCVAILVDFDDKDAHAVNIQSSEFVCVSYTLYSNNINIGIVTMDAVRIVGNAVGMESSPSHAVSLSTYKFLSVQIKRTAIKKTHEGISLTVTHGICRAYVQDSIFADNAGQSIIATFGANSNQEKSSVRLTGVEFVKNSGIFASAVHLVAKRAKSVKLKAKISDCIFYDNKADTFFGSVYADNVRLDVSNTFFANNAAGEVRGSTQGFGGAIYIEDESIVHVSDSTFINNTCSGFGGTIFSRGMFSCLNCSFTGASEVNIRPLLGDILYATAGLSLINTTWTSTIMSENPKSLIWHPGSPTIERWGITVSGYFKVTCPEGHNISYSGIIRQSYRVNRISISCIPCSTNQYSLTSGSLSVFQKNGRLLNSKKSVAHCFNCKYGGVCNTGTIRAQANYYGYRTGINNDEVRFVPCPVGYCCVGKSCQKYNSCQPGRTGLFCGSCKNGTTENLINSDCIDPRKCSDHWFWVLFLPFGIIYIISFMYLDKISAFIKRELVWWDNQIHHRHDLEEYEVLDARAKEDSVTENLTSHETQDDAEDPDAPLNPTNHDSDIHLQSIPTKEKKDIFKTSGKKVRGPDVFTDMLNTSFYFYQMFLLMRMRESIVMDYIMSCLRSVYTSLFTLSIEGGSSFILCPLPGLTAVTKLLFLKSFACYVLVLLFVFHTVVYLVQFFLLQDLRRKEALIVFSIRLKVATVQILLIAYATLSTTAVTLVTCIPMNITTVLLIDGTVTCYTWWQALIFIFVFTWVIPFPVAMVYSLIYLKKENITYHQFVLAWAFPFPYLVWELVVNAFIKPVERTRKRPDATSLIFDHPSIETEEKCSINEILFRLECPYKGVANHLLNKEESPGKEKKKNIFEVTEPAFWQGVLLGKRLILILILTFIRTPVSKYYCALLLCTLYLVHQIYYRPFLILAANIFETVTSMILLAFCSMNLFFAYSYVSDLPPEAADENLSIIFRWFEAIILVLLPTVAVLVLFVLVLTRIIILTGKLFGFIVDFCIRARTSNVV